ncbi:MAG: ATP-binding protein [Clostridia bacterium]|nr:ATP-binding protein [Clostridia bacterium]
MIQIIFGEKGTGKTKRMLELANRTANEAKGSMVFIDDDTSYMYDLNYSIRFINATEYGILGPKMFFGFLCGLAASDYDLEYIFIDGFLKLISHELDTLEEFFDKLLAFSAAHGINIILTASGKKEELPEFLRQYAM